MRCGSSPINWPRCCCAPCKSSTMVHSQQPRPRPRGRSWPRVAHWAVVSEQLVQRSTQATATPDTKCNHQEGAPGGSSSLHPVLRFCAIGVVQLVVVDERRSPSMPPKSASAKRPAREATRANYFVDSNHRDLNKIGCHCRAAIKLTMRRRQRVSGGNVRGITRSIFRGVLGSISEESLMGLSGGKH